MFSETPDQHQEKKKVTKKKAKAVPVTELFYIVGNTIYRPAVGAPYILFFFICPLFSRNNYTILERFHNKRIFDDFPGSAFHMLQHLFRRLAAVAIFLFLYGSAWLKTPRHETTLFPDTTGWV
jgi:hypothetical protein